MNEYKLSKSIGVCGKLCNRWEKFSETTTTATQKLFHNEIKSTEKDQVFVVIFFRLLWLKDLLWLFRSSHTLAFLLWGLTVLQTLTCHWHATQSWHTVRHREQIQLCKNHETKRITSQKKKIYLLLVLKTSNAFKRTVY